MVQLPFGKDIVIKKLAHLTYTQNISKKHFDNLKALLMINS